VKPFRPAWWLPGPHLPTIWGKKMRRLSVAHDRTEVVTTPDGDHLSLARMGCPQPGVPHLLILHGLEGTLRAKYAHGLLHGAKARGWSGDLLLFRSCDGRSNSAPRLYHSGETSDLDFIARRLVAASPLSPLLVCGVSLGGNVLLKWMAELGAAAPDLVKRAAVVSVPFDLAQGARHLESGFSRVYARHFLATLIPKALEKARQFPGLLDVDRILSAKTFWEFDDAATAPLHGFKGASDYYLRSSSLFLLHQVAVPTLVLASRDDPFVPSQVLSAMCRVTGEIDSFTVEITDRGGHVGWIEGIPLFERYYMERRVIAYLAQ